MPSRHLVATGRGKSISIIHTYIYPSLFPYEHLKKAFSMAAEQSSQINKAYQTLLSPLLRAEYILAAQGIHEDETDTLEDPEFIMEVMDIRQEIEDASDNETVTRLRTQNKGKQFSLEYSKRPLFSNCSTQKKSIILSIKSLD